MLIKSNEGLTCTISHKLQVQDGSAIFLFLISKGSVPKCRIRLFLSYDHRSDSTIAIYTMLMG